MRFVTGCRCDDVTVLKLSSAASLCGSVRGPDNVRLEPRTAATGRPRHGPGLRPATRPPGPARPGTGSIPGHSHQNSQPDPISQFCI